MPSRSVLVSVVLPTHNRGSTLADSVQSVLSQSFKDLELIVVDDGSEDDTQDVLAAIKDPRLKTVVIDDNKGANAARNIGVSEACGTFIAFQDSDDIWHQGKLEAQLESCASSGALVSFCAMDRIRSGRSQTVPKRSYKVPAGRTDLSEQLMFGSFISNQTLLIHRSCLLLDRFDESLGRLQDWDLCLRLTRRFDVFYLDQALVTVREGDQQISSGAESYLNAVQHIVAAHRAQFEDNPEALAAIWLNASALALGHSQLGLSIFALRKALTINILASAKAAIRLIGRALA